MNPSLQHYDGSAGTLVDTNVWIDCIDRHSQWHDWCVSRLQACSERGPVHVNLIVYTELLVPRPDVAALDALLDVYETQRSPLPWSTAALCAAAFALYRQRGGTRPRPLPDFFIGAHAAVAGLPVLAQDVRQYASYFPTVQLIAPGPN